MTVDNRTAERFARLDGRLTEPVLREAVEKTFRGSARAVQGVFAIHQHGGEWLARLADHIPDPGKHRTHFYAHYANRVHGERPSDELGSQVMPAHSWLAGGLGGRTPLTDEFRDRGRGFNVLSLDVWLAQGWNGQFARAIEQDPDIEYVIPKEGSSLFLDSLVIPAGAPHPDLRMRSLTSPSKPGSRTRSARPCATPRRTRRPCRCCPTRCGRPRHLPAPDVLARAELTGDVGEAVVLYDRLWTEVTSR